MLRRFWLLFNFYFCFFYSIRFFSELLCSSLFPVFPFGISTFELGIANFRANTLEIVDGRLTGYVLGEIVDQEAKTKWLLDLSEKFRIAVQDTIAIGDGANDIGMVKTAQIGIAFCAKPALKKIADVIIDERDLELVVPYL